MKTPLLFLFLMQFLLFSISGQAMDATRELADPTRSEASYRELLLAECGSYENFLNARLGCLVCTCCKLVFNRPLYQHVQTRREELSECRNVINGQVENWRLILRKRLSLMTGITSANGRSFLRACSSLLERMDGEEEEDSRKCVTCWEEDRTFLAKPCGHLLYCRKCRNQHKDAKRFATCALCRADVEEYLSLSLCEKCGQKADQFATCHRFMLCQECFDEDKTQHCPDCNQPTVFNKIHYW
ncbi:MAG TPA: RING-HC finger protein [Myxococcota bacterium]|nr:RING-HC finger protein [Myxococcota bacterium]